MPDDNLYLHVDGGSYDHNRRTVDFHETPRSDATHVVLNLHEYDDLVRRAEQFDQLVARAPRALVHHYAALVAAGYRGTWHHDGSVTFEPGGVGGGAAGARVDGREPAADDPARLVAWPGQDPADHG